MHCTRGGGVNDGQPGFEGKRISFTGRIRSMEEKNGKLILQVGHTSISDKNILLYLSENNTTEDELHIGQRISAKGEAGEFDSALNRGQFDQKKYYGVKDIAFPVYNVVISGTGTSYDHLRDGLYRIRKKTAGIYERYFDRRECGIVKALVLADRSSLDDEIKEEYQNAGISHILALSGLHIATVGFIVFGFLKKVNIPSCPAAMVSSGIIMLYCLMAGMPVSAVRALIMFLLSMGALLAGRTPDLRTCAAIAAVIMLIIRPDSLYDSSFLLSFSAVMGIGLVYPSVRYMVSTVIGRSRIQRLHRSEVWMIRSCMAVLKTLMFSVSIQLALLPFTMWFYYQIPVYGIFVNLIAVPLAGFLLLASVAVGLLGALTFISFVGPFFEVIIRIPVLTVKGILKLYGMLAAAQASLPGALFVTGRPERIIMWIYGAVLAAVSVGGAVLEQRERSGRIKRKQVRNIKTSAAFMLALCMSGIILLFVRDTPEFEISSLYTGQGQCFVIHGKDVPTVMYDCGSTDEKEAGRYMVMPFLKCCGIRHIDTVFVSHLDRDHVSGIIEILNAENTGMGIGRIVISGSKAQEESENYPELLKAAGRHMIPVYKMMAGDSVRYRNMSLKCLSPGGTEGLGESDINEGSLVLSVEYTPDDGNCFKALFTGDIGSETEDVLVSDGIERYDYLQVAHHGSRSSANRDFLKRVSPRIALISAGINNSYGHPHEETLNILEQIGQTRTFITSRDGETDMRVFTKRGRMRFVMVSLNAL